MRRQASRVLQRGDLGRQVGASGQLAPARRRGRVTTSTTATAISSRPPAPVNTFTAACVSKAMLAGQSRATPYQASPHKKAGGLTDLPPVGNGDRRVSDVRSFRNRPAASPRSRDGLLDAVIAGLLLHGRGDAPGAT